MNNVFVISGLALVAGFVWLGVWIFRKIMRGEIAVSVNTALLALLVIVLLVPFAMNLSAHFLYQNVHNPSGPSPEVTEGTTDSR